MLFVFTLYFFTLTILYCAGSDTPIDEISENQQEDGICNGDGLGTPCTQDECCTQADTCDAHIPEFHKESSSPALCSKPDTRLVLPAAEPYPVLKEKNTVCEEGTDIKTKEECSEALASLGLDAAIRWSGTATTVPTGCSYLKGNTHFNTGPNGNARNDLQPICEETAVFCNGTKCKQEECCETKLSSSCNDLESNGICHGKNSNGVQLFQIESAFKTNATCAENSGCEVNECCEAIDSCSIGDKQNGLCSSDKGLEMKFYLKLSAGAKGSVCDKRTVIKTAAECSTALGELGLDTAIGWSGSYSGVPSGCSYQKGKPHFNANAAGKGRSDLAPICRSESKDECQGEICKQEECCQVKVFPTCAGTKNICDGKNSDGLQFFKIKAAFETDATCAKYSGCEVSECCEAKDSCSSGDKQNALCSIDKGLEMKQFPKYSAGAKGSVCAKGTVLKTAAECSEALGELGFNTRINWNGNVGHVPSGCSGTTNPHFNANAAGKGRGDLAPLCTSESKHECQGEKCQQEECCQVKPKVGQKQ